MRLEAAQVGHRLGDAHHARVAREHSQRPSVPARRGILEALRRAETPRIGLWEAGTTTNTIAQAHIVRGEIRMARDDPAGGSRRR